MGREWLLYKASGGGDGGKSPSAVEAGKTKNGKKAKYNNTSPSGCMSAIYSLFDIQHHHQFRFHHPSFMPSESAIPDDDNQHSNFHLQGIEAPRNSLESPESVNEQTRLNIPLSRIQIKTNRSNFSDDLSPGTKTPNLVARLMGLEYSFPRSSSSSTMANSPYCSRSLPATPRLSTTSRKSTDTDYYHRLSLQIDKENHNNCKERINRKDDDRLSQHAKQITIQTRERISRRFGTDITNTVSPPARSKDQRRDLNLVKASANETTEKVRLLDIKGNLNKPVSSSRSSSSSIQEVKSKSQILGFQQSPLTKQKNKVLKDEKTKRMASERYDLRLKKMNVSKKKSTAKRLTSFKKEMTLSFSTTTKLSQKQVFLPSNLNSSYNSNDTRNLKAATTTTTTTSATGSDLSGWWLSSTAFETEVEGIVVEIEREILGNLVHAEVTSAVHVIV